MPATPSHQGHSAVGVPRPLWQLHVDPASIEFTPVEQVTDTDTRVDVPAIGEKFSAVLLECTMAGFVTRPLTHVTEVRVAGKILRSLLGHGATPTLKDVPPPTPRRPLDEVLQRTV